MPPETALLLKGGPHEGKRRDGDWRQEEAVERQQTHADQESSKPAHRMGHLGWTLIRPAVMNRRRVRRGGTERRRKLHLFPPGPSGHGRPDQDRRERWGR